MTVISVENLSKAYRLGQIGTGTLTNDLKVWWAKARGKPNPLLKIGQEDFSLRRAEGKGKGKGEMNSTLTSTSTSSPRPRSPVSRHSSTMNDERRTMNEQETIWALKDVSFSVNQGEVLGIIGRNGAGKSTLLKILSQITAPTSGNVNVKGRIASLLEVGTGFHPELTGRENIYLNGAILGMKKAEIARKFDEIVAFSEVEQFMDTPVKRYSSGMYVRLAFAVAAHLDPEILLVDEVLAVGDAAFQKKCLGKMGDVAKGGRTVLFVSHNMVAVKRLCPSTVLLHQGRVLVNASTDRALSQYLFGERRPLEGSCIFEPATAPGNDQARLRAVRLLRANGSVSAHFRIDEGFCVEVNAEVLRKLPDFHLYIRVASQDGTVVFGSGDWDGGPERAFANPTDPGPYRARCHVPPHLLNTGSYSVSVNGQIPQKDLLFSEEGLLDLEIDGQGGAGGVASLLRPGIVRPLLRWEVDSQGISRT